MRHILGVAGWMLLVAGWAILLCSWIGGLSPTLDAFASFLPLVPVTLLAALLARIGSRAGRNGTRRRTRMGGGAVLSAWAGIILSVLPILVEAVGADAEHRPAGAVRMVVVTHNLRGGGDTPARAAQVLADSDADILLLQEVRGADAVLRRLAARYPYRSACGSCELAILSRRPMGPVRWRLIDHAGRAAGPPLYRADVMLAGRTGGPVLSVATVHAPWPLPAAPQAAFRAALVDAVQQQASDRLILTGDFNLTPWGHGMTELDRGLRPMRRVTRARFSFPARLGDRDWPLPVLPIDHMFVGRAIAVGRIDTLPATGSDHRPIRAELFVSTS